MEEAQVIAPAAGGEVYVGPRPFLTGERLFGRDRETVALTNLLVAERVVLLYSPSGAGKTSLVQAGLVPRLRAPAEADPPAPSQPPFHVPAEAGRTDRTAPAVVIRVNTPLPDDLPALPAPPNRYVVSALAALEKHRPADRRAPEVLAALSVATPALTLARYAAEEFESSPLQTDDEVRPTVLIFDQFEEVLTADPTDTPAKRAFFEQLGTLMADRRWWVLVAVREDYLAALDPYLPYLPTRLDARYRLDRLGPRAALDAIVSPADRAVGAAEGERGVGFQLAAAKTLVKDLQEILVQQPDTTEGPKFDRKTGPFVEPVHLQVVCKSLWELQTPRTRANPVTEDEVRGAGGGAGVDAVLSRYYETKVKEAAERGGVGERQVRDWFEKRLITLSRSRRPVPRGEEQTDKEFRIPPAALRVLDQAYLVREDTRGGSQWLELAHDRLIEPVLQNNVAWRTANLKPFQREAAVWAGSRQEGLLLVGSVLKEAEEWAAANPALLSAADWDYLKESRRVAAERETQVWNRYVNLGLGAAAGLVAVVVVLFFGGRETGKLRAQQEQRENEAQAHQQAELARRYSDQQRETRQRQTSALSARLQQAITAERNPPPGTAGLNALREPLDILRAAEAIGFDLPDAESLLRAALQQVHTTQAKTRFDGAVRVIAFSPTGRRVVVGAEAGSSRAYDLTKGALDININPGEPVGAVDGPDKPVSLTAATFLPVEVAPAEDVIIWGDRSGRIIGERLTVPAGSAERYLRHFPSHRSAVRAIHVSNLSDDRKWHEWIASVDSSGIGELFQWSPRTPHYTLDKVPERLGRADAPPAGRVAAARGRQPPPGRRMSLTSVGFTPNPKKLYVGTTDGHVYAWDLRPRVPVVKLVQRAVADTAVTALAVHPRALALAVGTFRPNVRLWPMNPESKDISDDVKDSDPRDLTTAAVESLQFHHSGNWLAAVARDQTADLFSNPTPSDNPVAFKAPDDNSFGPKSTGRVTAVAFDPPGGPNRPLFLAGYPDGTARLWDLGRPGQAPHTLPGRRSAVTAVAIHPKQTFALIGYQDGTLTTWDIGAVLRGTDSEPRVILPDRYRELRQLSVSPDGLRFVGTGLVYVEHGVLSGDLDPTARRAEWAFPNVRFALSAVVDGPDTRIVGVEPPRSRDVYCHLEGERWAAARAEPEASWSIGLRDKPLALAFTPDRSLAALLHQGGGDFAGKNAPWGTGVSLLRTPPGAEPVRVGTALFPGPIGADTLNPQDSRVALSADGRVLACGAGGRSTPNQVLAWRIDPTTGQAEKARILHTGTPGKPLVIAVSPSGRTVAVGDTTGTVGVWGRWEDEREVPEKLYGHQKAVSALALIDDARLVSGSDDTTARVWNLRTGAVKVLTGHTGAVTALAVVPAGADRTGPRLVTAGADGSLRVWTLDRKDLIERAETILNPPKKP